MIVEMEKKLLVGAKDALGEFLLSAQEEGFIEFVTEKDRKNKELPVALQKIVEAIKILRKQPLKSSYKGREDLTFASEAAEEILHLQTDIEKLQEEKRNLEGELARVAPFGNFSFDDIAYIEAFGKRKVQFYCVKTTKAHEIEDSPFLFYVGTDFDLDFFIGIHSHPASYPNMIEMHFDQTEEQIRNHLTFVEETLQQMEAELKGFAGHLEFLKNSLVEHLDLYSLKKVKKSVELHFDNSLFSIEIWIPKNKIPRLKELISHYPLYFTSIEKDPLEKPPTHMENAPQTRLGEDLVSIYDIPASHDKDPSGWVLWFFTLFFAMIVADAGYGLIYLALAFLLKLKFPKLTPSRRRYLKLFFLLASASIVWGVLTCAFFGIQISPQNPIAKRSPLYQLALKKAAYHAKVKDPIYLDWNKTYPGFDQAHTPQDMLEKGVRIKDGKKHYEVASELTDSILLEFSLFLGIIHISSALLRYARKHLANISWILFIIGGYLYAPTILKATSAVQFLGGISSHIAALWGIRFMCVGMGGAVFLSVLQHKAKGLLEVTRFIQIFVDILSYLRLYALALAGSLMAETFNQLGLNTGKFMGFFVGFLILILGHGMNLLLATTAGFIHGLRLNFIEWYHYCFEGEGRLFSPLRKLKLNFKKE